MSELALCPLCKIPSPHQSEGEVCPQHPQRVLVKQSVVDEHGSDHFIGLLLDGKYELCRPLGHGGFGSVYYAVQRGQIRREVAIKLLTRQSPEYLDLFRDEMRMVAQLRSPYTVRYLDSGVHADLQLGRELPYMVMEYLQGETLAHRLIHKGAIPPAEAIELFDHLLDSLDEAHSFGIVHRDLKPLNLMITPTRQGGARLTVLDFGVARVVDQASREATRNRIMGTPYYLAPEVLLQQEVTPQGDLFAVGVILYETLMCRSPFLNEELQGVEPYLKLRGLYKAESSYEPIPAQLAAQFVPFFDRALAIPLQGRFQSASEMREALKECLTRTPKPLTASDTQFDLPKIDIEPLLPATIANLSSQSLRVQLNSSDQTVLSDRQSDRQSDEMLPMTVSISASSRELLPPAGGVHPPSSTPSPFNSLGPSPQANVREEDQAPHFLNAPTEGTSIEHLQTSPFLSLEGRLPKRSSGRLGLFIGGGVAVAVAMTGLVFLQKASIDPCVLTRAPAQLSAKQLEGERQSPPPGDRILRLRSTSIVRPCLNGSEAGCEGGAISCPVDSIYAQTKPLTLDELTLCQQAGMCDADSSTQGTQVRRCNEQSDLLCAPALIAYKYCAWRGLTIPTINAWYRITGERELRSVAPQWALTPQGELIKVTPQFQLDETGALGALSNLELALSTQEELLDPTSAPTASVRCVRAYRDK